ncbi:phage portal protein [Microvirga massiliensis]|uniref:phage portal protein n=1 Tax=Microvirga massiliensis TaxID=1033741 RepID=UPI0006997D14|nr:phage portal protein [Microvirga massiliensis]
MRDILDLSAKASDVVPVASTIDPEFWQEIGLSPDFWPSFGWNVPDPRRLESVGLALAVQCAAVKARDIAKAGMKLWRRQGRRWTEVEPGAHWFARMLARKPNSIHSWGEFWRMVIIHLELAQNSYILKRVTRLGDVLELLPLQPARCRPRISDTGRLFYEINAATEFERAQLGESVIIVPAERIIHLRGKLLDGLEGLSNARLGHPVFELLGAISSYQTSLFGSDGKQPLVFETDRDFGNAELADAAFRRLKEQLTERTRKARTHGDPILLEAGLKAKAIAVNARDALTTESYNQMVMRICGLMEVPPHKVHHYGDGSKYDNQAAANNAYANDSLIPIADNIEEKFRNELLPEDEWDDHWPEFDRMSLLAGDPKTLMDVIDKAVKDGLIEVNEARERLPLGLSPLEQGGDVRLVPVNFAIVDRQGNVIQQAATGQNQGTGQGGQNEDEDEQRAARERSLRLAVNND